MSREAPQLHAWPVRMIVTPVGIEAMNLYGGSAFVDVMQMAVHRKLDTARFDNLLMQQKSVALPYEDPVTFAINAARPVIDRLSEAATDGIDSLIHCSESGIAFGNSPRPYVHTPLALRRNCT